VSLLGLAATNMPALRTHAQVERAAAFLTVLCPRFGDLLFGVSTFGVGTGKELHYVVCVSVFPRYRSMITAGAVYNLDATPRPGCVSSQTTGCAASEWITTPVRRSVRGAYRLDVAEQR
jgi:hypothetical protein